MIKRLWKKIRQCWDKPAPHKGKKSSKYRHIARGDHGISRKQLSKNTLHVLYRLHNNGYEAYLVGGGVRDLLLGMDPKDFDVATNAHPEQVRRLFGNSRIIGRRFKLVHVFFGQEVVEVATFRKNYDPTSVSAHGLVLQDNVYGTLAEDALRRDFTVNALYYNIADFSIVDFSTGWRDLKNKNLCLIGDPLTRFREDPVRILRALRFAAKLDFHLDPSLLQPMRACSVLLGHMSRARVYEEMLKFFQYGYGSQSFTLLQKHGFFALLFPLLADPKLCAAHPVMSLITLTLKDTDARIHAGKKVQAAFLFASLFWYPFLAELQRRSKTPHFSDYEAAANLLLTEIVVSIALPKAVAQVVKELWVFQLRLMQLDRGRAVRIVHDPRFKAAVDLLVLRDAAKEPGLHQVAQFWHSYRMANAAEQERLLETLPARRRVRKRKTRRPPTEG